jgi:glucose/arabinose dehydrogenase
MGHPPSHPGRSPRLLGLLLLAVGVGAGCGGPDDTAPSPGTTATVDTPAPGRPTASDLSDLGTATVVASGIEVPWGLAFLPDGDALVAERESGRVIRVDGNGGRHREVLRVPGVVAEGEGGLLGLAVPPDAGADGPVYAYLTTDSDNRVVRFRLGSGEEPEVVLRGVARAATHNGGRIAFGPDGMLYVGTGDAGSPETAQDPDSPNGKILRLTPDGEPAPDNPDPGSPVFSLGHRNVQGLAWDEDGRFYAVEFGQNRFDEVNLVEPGANHGWPVVEGRGDTQGGRFTDPLVVWRTDEASPSGAVVVGNTLYVAALRGERLWVVPLADGRAGEPHAVLRGKLGRLRTVAVAPDGAVWLTTSNTDGRGVPREGDDRVLRFPGR